MTTPRTPGEIGAGHSVTALYEIVPIGKQVTAPSVDGLRYQQSEVDVAKRVETARSKELLTLKLRHKDPDGAKSQLMEIPLTDQGLPGEKSSRDFRFAAAVASFGMLLRDSPHKGNANWESTLELAVEGKNDDASGYRAEFISLIGKAKSVAGQSVDPR
jgi:Ca-activated chloride channel family protein